MDPQGSRRHDHRRRWRRLEGRQVIPPRAQRGQGTPRAAAEYNRLVAADAAAAVEQAAALEDAFTASGITFDGRPMRKFLRPHFIGGPAWERLREDGHP